MSLSLSRITPALTALALLAGCDDELVSPLAGAAGIEAAEAEATVEVTGRDRAAIREIVHTLDEAWTAGDAGRYASQYAGADFVGPDGSVLTDPDAITALYTALFTFVFPHTTRSSTIRHLTFLNARSAVLDIDTRVRGFGSLPPGVVPWRPGVIRALEKNVLVKRRGEWRIVQHQQTLLAPEP